MSTVTNRRNSNTSTESKLKHDPFLDEQEDNNDNEEIDTSIEPVDSNSDNSNNKQLKINTKSPTNTHAVNIDELPDIIVYSKPSLRERLMQLPILNDVLVVQLFLHLVCLLLILASNPAGYDRQHISVPGIVLSAFFALLSLIVQLLSTAQLFQAIITHKLTTINSVQMYLSTQLIYALLYYLCYISNYDSFELPSDDSTTGVFSVYVLFLYFTVTTTSTTGFGDVYPNNTITKCLVVSQMIISLVYVTTIFAVALQHFQANANNKKNNNTDDSNECSTFIQRSCNRFIPLDRIRKFIHDYCLLLILVSSFLLMLIMYLIDPKLFTRNRTDSVPIIIVLFIEIIQFFILVFVSLSLVKSIDNNNVSPWFLIQSYISVCIQFAGLYLTIYVCAGKDSFHLFDDAKANLPDNQSIPGVIGHLTFFSFVAQTSTGYGHVYPLHASGRFCATIQMLIGVFYSVVILGVGVSAAVPKIHQHIRPELKKFLGINNTNVDEDNDNIDDGNEDANQTNFTNIEQDIDNAINESKQDEKLDTSHNNNNNNNNTRDIIGLNDSCDLDTSNTSEINEARSHLKHVEIVRNTVINQNTSYEDWVKIRKELLRSIADYQNKIKHLENTVQQLQSKQ